LINKSEYIHDVREYSRFLTAVDMYVRGFEDAYYLSFMIDLLIKEVKYSSLLEINRANAKDKFIYPFHMFSSELLGYRPERKKIEIDFDKHNLISQPWKHRRYKDILKKLMASEFRYDEQNHEAYYYDYLNIACAYNGSHSLGVGTYLGKGKIIADYYDTTKIFPYIDVNEDLSFSFNKKNVLKRLEESPVNMPKEDIEKALKLRVYGTDYRLLLIYKLSQRKYFLK